jgi:glutamine synthetase
MSGLEIRSDAKRDSISRPLRQIERPKDNAGRPLKVSQYFGELVFDFKTAEGIPENVRKEMIEVAMTGKIINKESADVVAQAVTEWAMKKGATHFCHWFQPLTGSTAEKHDAFLQIKDGKPIEKLSASQLMQGEPDASSFPNGGSRSTFEARGYTTWDLTSPMFISEGPNGRTLCIPTAFVSYHGDALDIKTPLLRSVTRLNKVATKFLHLIGKTDVKEIMVTAGCEQEYFLLDKSFYYNRPDLVMSGRTVFGTLSVKNQQLEDHYFGLIPERILGFMQELDYELHRLGIPSKTRHNEVAPGQFEIAPIFSEANVAADQNQLLMATLKRVAAKHDMVVLLHEKPFAGINGSGKHVNWSMGSDTGINLLDPGSAPHHNRRFLAVIAIIFEAVNRYQGALRMSIASAANDHRLGANEAPPSIISVFLGDTLDRIFKSIHAGHDYTPADEQALDLGAHQLAALLKDNTDRNRTSPFAFTGNKFEFRAVGSSAAVGFPISILNGAVAKVMEESCQIIEDEIKGGATVDDALRTITKKWTDSSYEAIVFNGDGYSEEWVKEAARRGLKNLRTTPEALKILDMPKELDFLVEQNIFRAGELTTRHNVLIERYNKIREIEFKTLINMVQQNVIPAAIDYKMQLARVAKDQKEVGLEPTVELDILKKLQASTESLYKHLGIFEKTLESLSHDEQKRAEGLATDLFPKSVELAKYCNEIEAMIPNSMWGMPKYYDMLFLR